MTLCGILKCRGVAVTNRIVVIDDEQTFLDSVKRGLTARHFKDIKLVNDPRKAVHLFNDQQHNAEVALIDITMPGMDGVELLEIIKKKSPGTECIMVTALHDIRKAIECIKKGAYDYLLKPVSAEEIVFTIERAMERKRLLDAVSIHKGVPSDLDNPEAFQAIRTRARAMRSLLKEAELHASSEVPILITGETGTGKELLAQAIHRASQRSALPFTALNMAASPSTLFDAELFGYVKGAFTDAKADHRGYLECTDGGTIFFDEIGIMPLELQGKLLRLLQEKEYYKLGSNISRKIDVRFVAATNENPGSLMEKGSMRKDLYYRLRGAWLHLPPLRERKEDISLLLDSFLRELSGKSTPPAVPRETLDILTEYDFPGNVRELKSIIGAAMNLAEGGSIAPYLLPSYIKKNHGKPPEEADTSTTLLSEVEKRHILSVYKRTRNNKSKTAALLGIGLNTLRRKLKTYGAE